MAGAIHELPLQFFFYPKIMPDLFFEVSAEDIPAEVFSYRGDVPEGDLVDLFPVEIYLSFMDARKGLKERT